MTIEIRILGVDDLDLLTRVAPDVFDGPVDPRWSAEFLSDSRHHLAAAVDAGRIVGMASAVHYVHPDKGPELWINEVGVAPTHRGLGIGGRLVHALLEHGRALGCAEAWVLTDRSNEAALRLYAGAGGQEAPGETVLVSFPLRAGRPPDVPGSRTAGPERPPSRRRPEARPGELTESARDRPHPPNRPSQMDVVPRMDPAAGHSHPQRLAIARRLTESILARHGDAVVAIVVFGSTAIGTDGPFSDLDLTVVTREDLGGHSKCYPCDGLQINLDYQTVEESFEEAREPHEGGCWLDCLPLHDPTGLVAELASTFRAIGPDACRRAFLRVVHDDLFSAISKARNAVLAADRASFVAALCSFGQATCRGLCMLNGNRAVTGNARLIAEAKSLPIRPPRFGELIDIISGAVASADQVRYDSAEELWAGLLGIVEELGLRSDEPDLLV